MDYLGSLVSVPFAAHGYASYFVLSLLDQCVLVCYPCRISGVGRRAELLMLLCRYHKPEASVEEGIEILKRCIDEVSKRLVVDPGKYMVKVVDKNGARVVQI